MKFRYASKMSCSYKVRILKNHSSKLFPKDLELILFPFQHTEHYSNEIKSN